MMKIGPKRLKYRKYFALKQNNKTQFCLDKHKILGVAGLLARDQMKIQRNQVEACRVAIRRKMKKKSTKL